MAISSHERFHLKKFVKELGSYKALHTEFVSIYIPVGYDLNKIINHLSQEQGTATNIKSAVTKKNVIDALERLIQHLRLYKQTPDNGLAAFAGNIASREGKVDVRVWSIEPPVPLKTRIYRCDKNFKLDLLGEMFISNECFGLIVLDARDAHIALLRGKSIQLLLKTHSHVPGKMRAGGQSSVRFARNRELAVKAHFKKVGDLVKDNFLTLKGLKGILVGGPGPTKYQFVEGDYITNEVKKKIIGIRDLSYTEEFGLQELVDKSQDVLAEEEIADEKKIMARFLDHLARKPNLVQYGVDHVKKVLEMGAVQTLLLSEALPEDEIDVFEALSKRYGTEVKIISVETREGAQLRDIGLVGALLRYAVEE